MEHREKLIVILNGISRNKNKFYRAILPGLSEKFDVDVWETLSANHAIELGRKAVSLSPKGIFAAGGDGTLNQVLNGLMRSFAIGNKLPGLGIIPLGTGNDFARMESIKPSAHSILEKIERGGRLTDVCQLNCKNENGESIKRYFINVASLGMGPDVVKRLNKSNRALGPMLTYLKAITQTFFSHKPETMEIKADQWSWSGKLRVLAIANGQFFGNGLCIAPDAKPDDGEISTFIAGDIPLLKFLWLLQLIKSKIKIVDPQLRYNKSKKLYICSIHPAWIETEGELAGMLPASVEILPKAIRFFR